MTDLGDEIPSLPAANEPVSGQLPNIEPHGVCLIREVVRRTPMERRRHGQRSGYRLSGVKRRKLVWVLARGEWRGEKA